MSFVPEKLMEEVQKRPALWNPEMAAAVDRLEKLMLWKEIGAALYKDWDTINKATAYDRVLQLQKKWRSYRDAYNRELRKRRSNSQHHRVYVFFDNLKFLGGYEGLASPYNSREDRLEEMVFSEFATGEDNAEDLRQEENNEAEDEPEQDEQKETPDPLVHKLKRKRRKQKAAKSPQSSYEFEETEQIHVPFLIESQSETADDDSDKLFLLSFVPEMKKLPLNIKMWVRTQVANIMQEAVTSHMDNTTPSATRYDGNKISIKRQRRSSSE